MTKMDRVNKEGEISQKEFQEREQRFIKALGLAGVTTRYLSMHNYCDDTDQRKKRLTSTIPEIDAPLLQFMLQVCDPAITVTNPDFTFTSKGQEWSPPKDGVRKRKENEQNKKNEEIEKKVQIKIKDGDAINTVKMAIAVFVIIVVIYFVLFKLFV